MLQRMRTWAWWLPENRRVTPVSIVSVVLTLVLGQRPDGLNSWFSRTLDNIVLVLIFYFVLYPILTMVVFRLTDRRAIEAWAHTESRGSFLERYVWSTAPGPGLSIFVGVAALLVTVLWLPGLVSDGSSYGPSARIALAVCLVIAAWVTVAVSFTIAYLAEDAQSEGAALGFPGPKEDELRPLSDYAYVALALSTTFGTTDVDLQTHEVRRTALVHAVVAFVFNTVVLAVVVSLLA